MKNLLKYSMIVIALIVAMAYSVARALDDVPVPTDGAFYDGTVNSGARAALHVTITAEILAAVTAQSDTNVTTTAALYTPRRVGDLLVGSQGSGTNAIWVAVGATTNDWVKIKP
mgnify:CR=1 FL=1